MVGFYNITDAGAANIVAYLRTLATSVDSGTSSGDPQKGAALFKSSGCSACHMIAGQGGSIGPDLTRIGAARGPTGLKQRLLDPAANLPKLGGGGMMGNSWTAICDVPCCRKGRARSGRDSHERGLVYDHR